MKSGIYRFYARRGQNRICLGRVVVTNGHTHVVEDRDGTLSRVVPDGTIDDQKTERWQQLSRSPYFDVVSEADLEPEQIHQPEISPDEVFDVVDDVLGTRRRLKTYGEDFFLDGVHLTPEQVESLTSKVRHGELHLLVTT